MEKEVTSLSQGCEIEWTYTFGNFNILSTREIPSSSMQPIPYRRRNFYKINLLKGTYKIHYAEKTYTIQKQGLVFTNPSIPYDWIPGSGTHSITSCLFTPEFFHQFGDINSYAVFKPNGTHVLELDDQQYQEVEWSFNKMQDEFGSDYVHKSDLLRNLVYEVVHFGTKLSPQTTYFQPHSDSAKRITEAFLKLLEGQFPIEKTNQHLLLTSPADFADKLSLHVNYLNRVLKKTMGSSTSKIIHERILRESKILLTYSSLTISEISFLLGFKEVSHFSTFFRKIESINPSDFRKV